MSEPSLLTTEQAAERLGMSARTLREWAAEDAALKACAVRSTKRSTWWSVQRLRDGGYLVTPTTETRGVAV